MRNVLLIVVSLLSSVLHAEASLIVYDPVNHGTQVVNEIQNVLLWAKTEVATVQTQLNTLNQLEEQILTVERMGDPRTLTANIPGVQNIQTLGEIYAQAQQDISDWSAFVNPESWKMTADGILNVYGQPGFDGFTAANGIHVGEARSLVQFQVSNFNVDKGAQQTVDKLNAQLKTLTQQLATATSAMQSATTTSAVQKYASVISALHASIDATNGALQQAKFSEQLQTQQNAAAQEITRSTQAEAVQMSDYQAIDEGLRGLPVGQMSAPMLWGQP